MEGDMKEIVLERLEQRLKEKDDELHSLKKQLASPVDGEDLKGLREKVDTLAADVRETQLTLSEVMKKVGALEAALNSMLMSMTDDGEADPGEDLSVPGSLPMDSRRFDGGFAAGADQKDIKEDGESMTAINDGHKDADALRFFHLSRNS
jgi:hypothetical protein